MMNQRTITEVNLPEGAIKEITSDRKANDVTFEVNFSMQRGDNHFDPAFWLPKKVAKWAVRVNYDSFSIELLDIADNTFCYLSGTVKVYHSIYIAVANGGFGRGLIQQPQQPFATENLQCKVLRVPHRQFTPGLQVKFADPLVMPVKIEVWLIIHHNKQPADRWPHQTSFPRLPFFQDTFESGKDSDFKIICGDREINVHKVILRKQSEFFATAFDTEIGGVKKTSIDLSHCEYRILYEAIRFCYSHESPSEELALELLQLANELFIPKLQHWATEVVTGKLNEENVCDVLVLADKLHEVCLKFHARCYFLQHPRAIMRTKGFDSLPENLVRELMEAYVEENDNSMPVCPKC